MCTHTYDMYPGTLVRTRRYTRYTYDMYTLVYIIPGTGVQEHIFFLTLTHDMQINNLHVFNIQSSEHLELHEASHVHECRNLHVCDFM